MRGDLVLVRAFEGEPLIRAVWETARAHIYVCNPEHIDDVASGMRSAVGFPPQDVFELDERLAEDLRLAYQRGDSARLNQLWRAARAVTADAGA